MRYILRQNKRIMRRINYCQRFLFQVDERKNFLYLEMYDKRLPVEHSVTEILSGTAVDPWKYSAGNLVPGILHVEARLSIHFVKD